MKIHLYTLKQDHKGLKAGWKTGHHEDMLEWFEEKGMKHRIEESDELVTLDIKDKTLFDVKIIEYPDVTVKDVIEYLQNNFNLTDNVSLDTDGWMQAYIKPKNVQDLIDKRGLFYKTKDGISIYNR